MRRFLAMFRKRKLDQELEEELRFHLETQIEENLRRGMTRERARQEAERSFGGVEQAKAAYRDWRGVRILDEFVQDVRYGARALRRSPGFTVVAILTLALGIGAISAIFSVVNAVLLKPLPFREAGRLVLVRQQILKFGPQPMQVAAPDTVEYRKSEVFEEAGAMRNRTYDLSGEAGPEQIAGARVSANLLPMLGGTPLTGRLFSEEEERLNSRVVILSHGLWRRRYGGDSRIIGRTILVDRESYEVIGVTPPRFVFPPKGMQLEGPADLWVPLSLTPAELRTYLDNPSYTVVGRLRKDTSVERASAEMLTIARHIQASFQPQFKKALPPDLEMTAFVAPFREQVVGGSRRLLFLLLGAVGFLWLIACVNLANMLLSRGSTRGRELALRAALGAGRGRLIRQLLTESVLLSILGGALGILLAWLGTGLLVAALPGDLPLTEQIRVDYQALAFVFLVSIAGGLLFGLAPALVGSRTNLNGSIKESGRRGWLLNGLVSGQLAMALVLTGAGLLIRSFVRLHNSDLGFRTERLLTASIALPESQYKDDRTARDFYEKLLPKLESLPGALVAGMATDIPLEGTWARIATPEGSAAHQIPVVYNTLVYGDYFRALGMPLKGGRFFTEQDRPGGARVVIVNETLARQFWTGMNPVGRRLTWGTPEMKMPWLTVVGLIGDVNQAAPDDKLFPHVYEPYLQTNGGVFGWVRKMNLALRTAGDPMALANAVRAEVGQLDKELPVTKLRSMEQIINRSLASRRLSMWLLTVFAAAALLLSALGIYGVMSYAVARRTQEIGIRMALGAQRASVLRMVLAQGMKLVGGGLIIGLAASLALTRLMASLLYGVSPADPITFGSVVLLLTIISLAAHFAPVRRAVSVDPTIALRHE